MGRVWSLFDRTGAWCEPYRERGDVVRQVDLWDGDDVRLIQASAELPDVILSAPPCQAFAGAGARWWAEKGDAALTDGLALVDAVFRLVAVHSPSVWALENPIGRLVHYIGTPAFSFDPCDFAGWADEPSEEAYTKRTCLWGRFEIPEKRWVPPVLGSKMHKLPPTADRADLRSVTPQGFARAFAAANPAIQDARLAP